MQVNSYQQKLDAFRLSKRIPHILFYGDSGSGKKTIVYNFIHSIYQDACVESGHPPNHLNQIMQRNVMWVNCAQGKGIKFVRNELKMFAQTNACIGVPFKTIVLLNADHLTIDAQSALRRCMEQHSQTARFFGIVRNRHRLMCPILSRFCEIQLRPEMNDALLMTHVNVLQPCVNVLQPCVNFHQQKILSMFSNCIAGQEQTTAFIEQTICELKTKEFDPKFISEKMVNIAECFYGRGISSLDILRWMRSETAAVQSGISKERLVHICLSAVTEKNEYHNEKLFMYRLLEQCCL